MRSDEYAADAEFADDLKKATDAVALQRLQVEALWKIGKALESLAYSVAHLQDDTGNINVSASVTVEKNDWSIE
jgi:hypothetical protein